MKDVTLHGDSMEEERQQKPILANISLSIKEGEWISLIGTNGSGKSTLAKLIAGVPMALVSGEIRRSEACTRRQGGRIPILLQQPHAGIIGDTPWEDVVLLLERQGMASKPIAAAAEAALQAVGLGERMKQSVSSLSGGQLQLTAIAGCLAGGAPMLIFDEATSMLDPHASLYVQERIRSLHGDGVTVLWITQKLPELRSEDRVLVMQGGELAFDGKAETLFERGEDKEGSSAAELLGLKPPYAVETAWELRKEGIDLRPLPFTAEQLAEAVISYGG